MTTPERFFLQMSGVPGSGKTTLAMALGAETGAVVIDHDVTKTALLDADIPLQLAGRGSYAVLLAIARHLLEQGRSVILDSPCFYSDLLEKGQRIAAEADAAYKYIECRLEDFDELNRRLKSRATNRSQVIDIHTPPRDEEIPKGWSGKAVFTDWMENMKRPRDGFLVVDAKESLEMYLPEALAYITR